MRTVGVMVIERDDGRFVAVEFGHEGGERALRVRGRDEERTLRQHSSSDEDLEFAEMVDRASTYATALDVHREYPGVAVGIPGGIPTAGYRSLLGGPRG